VSDHSGSDAALNDQAVPGFGTANGTLAGWACAPSARLQDAKNQGWELIGAAQPSANRSGLHSAFRIKASNIDIAKRSVRSPRGYLSTQGSPSQESKRQEFSFRFKWSYHCRGCPLRSECVPARQSHCTIVVGQYPDLLHQRRLDQQTEQFKGRTQ
jgi:hypothetical protein